MVVHLYTRCYNDSDMLGFFFRHYDGFVDRYFVFDDQSTDDSWKKLAAHRKVDCRPFPPYSNPDSRVESGITLQNSCWQESRAVADWVIIVDIDEHLYHPDMGRYLEDCKHNGVTFMPCFGFTMISDAFPSADALLCHEIVVGMPEPMMNKPTIFSPAFIDECNFEVGRHRAKPSGNIVLPKNVELALLHYKYIDFERLVQRHARALARQRPLDLKNRWGHKYSWTTDQLRTDWARVQRDAVDYRLGLADLASKPIDSGCWWHPFQNPKGKP